MGVKDVGLVFKSSPLIGQSDLVFFQYLEYQSYFGVGGLDADDHQSCNPTPFWKRSDPVGNGKRLIIARES